MKLKLFGIPEAVNEVSPGALPLTRPALLLFYLAHRVDWATRDELALLFRPESDEKTARQTVRLLLSRARKFSWAAGLEKKSDSLRFVVPSDLSAFRSSVTRRAWAQAYRLYTGELLSGVTGAGLPSYGRWLEAERTALRTSWQEAARHYAAQLVEQSNHTDAAAVLSRVLASDPLAEDVLQAYMRSSYLAGQAGRARLAFATFRERLEKELGFEPLAETRALAEVLGRVNVPAFSEEQRRPVPLTVLRPPVLVGRSDEARALRDAATHLVILEGEAGVGKTRLLEETAPHATWLRCSEGTTQVPYLPLIAAVKRLAHPPDEGAHGELLRLLPGADATPRADPDTTKARFLETLAVTLEAARLPIIFDDLQWADAATLEFLFYVAGRANVRIFVAVRGEELSVRVRSLLNSLKRHTHVRELRLSPLDQGAVGTLLETLSAGTSKVREFAAWLHEKCGGNPFVLLEVLRSLFEAGVLTDGPRWYDEAERVTSTLSTLPVPSGVAALIERRVDALSGEAKRALDLASVQGDGVSVGLTAKLTGLSAWAAVDALTELEAQGLVVQGRFNHDLTRQTLYRALPDSRRRALHELLAEALSEEADALVIAEHCHRAGKRLRAATLWFDTARSRFNAGRFEGEAAALYERILTLDLREPVTYRAKAYLAERYLDLNRLDEASALIESVLQESDDAHARTYATLQQMFLHRLRGEMERAQETLAAAQAQVAHCDDAELEEDVALATVAMNEYLGKLSEALASAERVVARKRDGPASHALVSWLSTLAYVQCSLGRFEEALATYREQLEVARALNFVNSQVQAASDIMATLYDLGRIQEGLELGEAALELGEYDVTFPLRYHLALAYFEQGRFEDTLAQSDAVLKGRSSLNIKSHTLALVAETHSAQGDFGASYGALDRGLELVEAADHVDARAVVTIAALKFGSSDHVARATPFVAQLSNTSLPAYLQTDFEAALALGRHFPPD